jgi:hypothetical protein
MAFAAKKFRWRQADLEIPFKGAYQDSTFDTCNLIAFRVCSKTVEPAFLMKNAG